MARSDAPADVEPASPPDEDEPEPEPAHAPEDTPSPSAPDVHAATADPVEESGEESASVEVDAEEPGITEIVEDVWPARHLFVKVKGTALDDSTRQWLSEVKPGGVVLQGENIESLDQVERLVAQIKEAVGLGTEVSDLPLIAVDQEGGVVNRMKLEPAPAAAALGRGRDLEAARETGRRYADECRKRRVGVILAPVLDVYETGAEESMKTRSFGQDSGLVTAMGLAFADGVMAGGVLSVAKHYPGHGVAKQDSHVSLAVIEKDGAELAKIAFPFVKAAERGIRGIMVGHIAAPALDPGHPMRPASLSPVLVKGIFRDRYQYDGVLITDDMAMGAIASTLSLAEASVEALAAGCDAVIALDPVPEHIDAVCAAIEAATESDALSLSELQASKRRLEGWQEWLRNPTRLKEPLPDLTGVPEDAAIEPEEAVEPETPPTEDLPSKPPAGTREVIYEIRPGDSLSRIAGAHGVKVDDIMEWNGLAGQKILSGKKLRIYVPGGDADTAGEAASEDDADVSEEDGVAGDVEGEASDSQDGDNDEASAADRSFYVLKSGDTLAKLSNQFDVPIDDLKQANNIDEPNRLRVGQKIRIPNL